MSFARMRTWGLFAFPVSRLCEYVCFWMRRNMIELTVATGFAQSTFGEIIMRALHHKPRTLFLYVLCVMIHRGTGRGMKIRTSQWTHTSFRIQELVTSSVRKWKQMEHWKIPPAEVRVKRKRTNAKQSGVQRLWLSQSRSVAIHFILVPFLCVMNSAHRVLPHFVHHTELLYNMTVYLY